MQFRKKEKNDSFTIDIAPLVDVVFLLLIFFMLSTSFEIHPGLKVNLPETSSKELDKKPKNVKIVISKSGKIYFNNKKVDINSLSKNFQKIKNKKTLVVIEADKLAYHGTVVTVMDLAKRNGLNNFAIVTKLKQ